MPDGFTVKTTPVLINYPWRLTSLQLQEAKRSNLDDERNQMEHMRRKIRLSVTNGWHRFAFSSLAQPESVRSSTGVLHKPNPDCAPAKRLVSLTCRLKWIKFRGRQRQRHLWWYPWFVQPAKVPISVTDCGTLEQRSIFPRSFIAASIQSESCNYSSLIHCTGGLLMT